VVADSHDSGDVSHREHSHDESHTHHEEHSSHDGHGDHGGGHKRGGMHAGHEQMFRRRF